MVESPLLAPRAASKARTRGLTFGVLCYLITVVDLVSFLESPAFWSSRRNIGTFSWDLQSFFGVWWGCQRRCFTATREGLSPLCLLCAKIEGVKKQELPFRFYCGVLKHALYGILVELLKLFMAFRIIWKTNLLLSREVFVGSRCTVFRVHGRVEYDRSITWQWLSGTENVGQSAAYPELQTVNYWLFRHFIFECVVQLLVWSC